MVDGDVVAMLVVHVDDIKIAAPKEITDSVVADINKRFPKKHLGEATWYVHGGRDLPPMPTIHKVPWFVG